MSIIHSKCIGCGACSVVCQVSAVKMIVDKSGFYRPEVNKQKCIRCQKCEEICPENKESIPHNIKCYAAINENEVERSYASSGGVFGIFAKHILFYGGTVYGSVFNNEFLPCTEEANTVSELAQMHGAKYIQGKAWHTFSKLKNYLNKGKIVMFTGIPCQIAGLKSYLGKEYNNLYCVEVACHGIPSHLEFQQYILSLKEEDSSLSGNLCEFYFRDKRITDKTFSWKEYFITAKFKKGIYRKPFRQDTYMQAFFNDLSIREDCFVCKHKLYYSSADITMADFWGITEINHNWDDDKGTSLVVIHTKKGMELFKQVIPVMKLCEEVSPDVALKHNQFIVKTAKPHEKYRVFQNNIQKNINYKKNLQLCLKRNFMIKVRDKVNKYKKLNE